MAARFPGFLSFSNETIEKTANPMLVCMCSLPTSQYY